MNETSDEIDVREFTDIDPERPATLRTCEECGKTFLTKALLNRHMISHSGVKRHKCHLCGKQYTQSWSLKAHMVKHTGERAKPTGECHACTDCGKVFGTKALVKRHMISHTGEKKHQCKICGKQYTQSWSLKTHMVKHSGESISTEHCCEVCGKDYPSLWLLNRHMNSHSEFKQNVCHICNKSYTQAWSLKIHMAKHDEKPQVHACPVCGKMFGTVSLVNRHLISHSAVKKHTCPVCGRAYTQSWSLKTHMMSKHVVLSLPAISDHLRKTNLQMMMVSETSNERSIPIEPMKQMPMPVVNPDTPENKINNEEKINIQVKQEKNSDNESNEFTAQKNLKVAEHVNDVDAQEIVKDGEDVTDSCDESDDYVAVSHCENKGFLD